MRSLDRVRAYFDREAKRFDDIYEDEKALRERVVDRLFRRVIVERFRLICNLAPEAGGFTVLDVGCGGGRYSVPLAERGASRVVGVDVSAPMLEIARRKALERGVADRCGFVESSFSAFRT